MEINFNTLRSICKYQTFNWEEYTDETQTSSKRLYSCENNKNSSGECNKTNCPLNKK